MMCTLEKSNLSVILVWMFKSASFSLSLSLFLLWSYRDNLIDFQNAFGFPMTFQSLLLDQVSLLTFFENTKQNVNAEKLWHSFSGLCVDAKLTHTHAHTCNSSFNVSWALALLFRPPMCYPNTSTLSVQWSTEVM